MVYIKEWENFVSQIMDLFFESPITSRFTIKYTHSKRLAILKATDNKKVFQFKCKSADDFQKIEQITILVSKTFGNIPEPEEQPEKMEIEVQEQQNQQQAKSKKQKKKKQSKKK